MDDETSGNVTFLANNPQANWNWGQNDYFGTQMLLDWQGNLTLIDSNTTNDIIAVPGNFSLVLTNNATVLSTIPLANASITYPSTTFSGNGNLSLGGNVVLDESDGILNLGSLSIIGYGVFFSDGASSTSVDDFYTGISFNNGASIMPGSSVPGLVISTGLYGSGFGLGIGPNANATNDISIAIGSNSTATGIGSITLSNSTSSGNMAIAIGNVSAASGNDATAISGGNATGDNSVAIGIGTVSETWGTTAIGRYNSAISGNATAWSSGDPSFIVGIGGNSTTQKNGLVVYNNGTCLINGNSTFANPSYVSPTSPTQPQEFQVGNTATFNGQVTLAGNIIITEPQGDIPVGEYDSSNSH